LEKGVSVFVKVKVAELVDQRVQSVLGGFFGSVCSSVNAANENKKRDLISFGKSIFTAQQQQRGGGGKLQNCLQSRLQASVLIT
jgi:hypothetical protein